MLIEVFKRSVYIILGLFFLLAGKPAIGQDKHLGKDFWYKWNVSFGVAVPVSFYPNSTFNNTLYRDFNQNSGPGLVYTLSKPFGKRFQLGVEIEDISLKGDKISLSSQSGIPATSTEYFTRFLNSNIVFQYNLFPEHFIDPFLIVKGGTSGVTTRLTESRPDDPNLPGYQITNEKNNQARTDNLFFTFGAGITMQLHPMLSVNIFGETTPMPENYLNALPDSRDQIQFSQLKDFVSISRVVITVTSYSDLSEIFKPKKKVKNIDKRGNPVFSEYLPFFHKHRKKK
jgi:hypothetical protein